MAKREDEKKIDLDEMTDSALEKADTHALTRLEEIPEKIDPEVANLIPQEVAQRLGFMFFDKKGNTVKAAMLDSRNTDAFNALRFVVEKENLEVEIYEVSPEVFERMLKTYDTPVEMVKKAVASFEGEVSEGEFTKKEIKKEEERKEEILKDAPVAKLVQVIITHAIEGRASDIHIEPTDKDYRVRYRVDGSLHTSLILPKEIGPVVVSRIKIMANLKIDEKRKPQDGRFNLKTGAEKGEGERDIDFRVSTLPVLMGEKIVMRILEKNEGFINLEALGVMGSAMDNLLSAIRESYGMILITGPTGSGKSTTLYAALKILNKEEENITTLEDPIEYNINGLNQSQINPEIDYTFANGLRTILRQDPNIIMLGEIRDSETAALSIHAALTGHLVLSTLHTNTAVGAIPRMIDMGVEPFLLASALRMVIAQRLVRRICPDCLEEVKVTGKIRAVFENEIKNIPQEEIKKYGIKPEEGIHFFHGKGCKKCNNLGLKGRIAVYEMVPVNDVMRSIMVEKSGNELLLVQERDKNKILTMKQDGILKIIKGLTTVEEVERVTEGEIGLLIDEE